MIVLVWAAAAETVHLMQNMWHTPVRFPVQVELDMMKLSH